MKIKKIKIKDFSVIKALDLELPNKVLIEGDSMTGKTTFINAIEVCLTGKLNGKAITKKKFGDKAYVSIELEDKTIISWSGDEPKSVYVNGIVKSDKQLEKEILHCTLDQFLFEFYPEKFWELSPKEKRKIFSDKFIEDKKSFREKEWEKEFPNIDTPDNLEDLSVGYKYFNSKLKNLKDKYIGINAVQVSTDEDIDNALDKLSEIKKVAVPKFEEKIYLAHLQSKPNMEVSKRDLLETSLLAVEKEIFILRPPERDESYKILSEDLLSQSEDIKKKGAEIKSRIFKEEKTCNHCGQDIPENLINQSKENFEKINTEEFNSLKKNLKEIMPKYKEALKKDKELFSEYKKSLLDYQKELDSLTIKKRDLQEDINADPNNVSNDQISTWQKRTDELTILKNQFDEAKLTNLKYDQVENEISNLKEKKMRIIEEITSKNYASQINELEKVVIFFSPKGVEKKEMEFIQDKIKSSLPKGYNVSLFRETGKGDITLEFEISSEDGYNNFSSGEKLFISHAISSMISNAGLVTVDNSHNWSFDFLETKCQEFMIKTVPDKKLSINGKVI